MAIVKPFSQALQDVYDVELAELGQRVSPLFKRLGICEKRTDEHTVLDTYPSVRALDPFGVDIDLLQWVNNVRTGKTFTYLKHALEPLPPDKYSNHQLWHFVSVYLAEIYEYVRKLPKTQTLPLKDLIVRNKDDFVSGTWNAFKEHWLPYIHLLPEDKKDEVIIINSAI